MAMTKEKRWWEGRLIALDLETTDPEPEQARIVTAAVVGCGDGPLLPKAWLADPGVEIPAGATEVHGITTERAREEGQPVGEVVEAVALEVAEAVALGLPLCVFNARYDLTVLDRESRRHLGRPLLPDDSALCVIDPLTCDKHLHRYRKGSRKLIAICQFRGAVLDGAHDAYSDALAAARLAWVIGAKGTVIRRVRDAREEAELQVLQNEWEAVRNDLPALHAAQQRWAHEQAVSLAHYFLEQGQYANAEEVRPEWPVVPFSEPSIAA